LSRIGHALLLLVPILIIVATGYWLYKSLGESVDRTNDVIAWLNDPQDHPEWAVHAGEKCGDAPFQMPTNGFIGYLWEDSFQVGHRHQGIDIFGGAQVNVTPVYAAYPGYLTRLPDWKSSLILRLPDDPLHPGRQIWIYYAHMAGPQGDSYISEAYPPGSQEVYVEAGALLGRQGNYSGDPANPVGVHLHFSIVLDDGSGRFLNELEIRNTLDPSPYLGLPLNGKQNKNRIPVCPGQG
jgi:hypothetical protein